MAVGNGSNGGNCCYKMIKDGMGNLTCTVFFLWDILITNRSYH